MWPHLLRFFSRIGYAWARRRMDDESRREFDTHLDLLVDRYTRLGMTLDEAQVAARRQFGNVTRAREEIYDMNGISWVDWLSQDLRYALRQLLRSPGFTLTTVLTLAIGIGATAAIFSVVNGILIKPLPFPESDRLIALVHQAPGVNQYEMAASPAIYFTYREHSQTFESVALWYSSTASVTGAGDPEEVQRLHSTHELLPLLRVKLLLGRPFSTADDQPGSPGTVILSYGYWQRRFGGAAAALGETLVVDGAPHEIIGVLPQEFRFLPQQAEILTPAQPNRARAFVPSMGDAVSRGSRME